MKIIQALSELFLQLFKNKKGSNEHTHTHTHKDTPMIENVWILRLALSIRTETRVMLQTCQRMPRLSANHLGWVRGIGQIFSHSPQKETSLVDTLILNC